MRTRQVGTLVLINLINMRYFFYRDAVLGLDDLRDFTLHGQVQVRS